MDGSDPNHPHEAKLLALSIDKAAALLGWQPAWEFAEAVQRTVAWYHQRHILKHPAMLDFSNAQIDDYVAAARRKNLAWASQP